ncbi:MAG TPA: tetratricopeptide repeat protein [Chitinophagaceae bacterium]|nr:tetratricopeptide repeat protein [Chitinophagaceae bacterium]
MKRILIAVSFITAFTSTGVKAQTLQEGINHLYADRFANAVQVFQKILAVNPNVIEATYWLGQTYLDMDENDAARQLYDKALQLNGNAPLFLVGRGHVHLLDKKIEQARQMFEAAITISKTRKGDDPVVLNAVGRANVDAKEGNFQYAIQVLEQALQRDPKNAEIALNLGNAYRKANPGAGGGKAYEYYQMALQLNPKFVYPYIRVAKLFETQKNWDFVLENLTKAIEIDPNFSLALHELFYYYFLTRDYTKAENFLNRYIQSKVPEVDIQDEYLFAQLCWAKKDYACAISKAQNVENTMGAKTKPKVYKLLANSYVDNGDTASAKPYIDKYFAREKPEDIISYDLVLKGKIYGATSGDETIVFDSYVKAAELDTVYTDMIKTLQDGADYFKAKGNRIKEAEMREVLYNAKKDPSSGELFNVGLAYYQAQNFPKAIEKFTMYSAMSPDSIYGYFWGGRANSAIDTAMTEGLALPFYLKTIEVAFKDKERFTGMGIEACGYLAGYYNNIKGNRDTAIIFIQKGLEFDSTNASLKSTLEILQKVGQNKQNTPKAQSRPGTKPVSSIRKPPVENAGIVKN